MTKKHRLSGVPSRWVFHQPLLGVSSPIVEVPEKGDRKTHRVKVQSSCRDGVMSLARQAMIPWVRAKRESRNPNLPYYRPRKVVELNSDLELGMAEDLQNELTSIFISKAGIGNCSRNTFLNVCDVLLGPICVLLNPNRQAGEWADLRNKNEPGKIHWYGSDNFFMYHPALAALVLGIFRQAALLCRAGYASQVIGKQNLGKVQRMLREADRKEARRILRQKRSWIEVPVAKGGYRTHFPFPTGYFGRLLVLLTSVEKHGISRTFPDEMLQNWRLSAKDLYTYSHYAPGNWTRGLWSTWGGTNANARYAQMKRLSERKATESRPARVAEDTHPQ